MDKQPLVDRPILIPILIGVISLFGICLVLLFGRLSAPRGSVSAENTATPFKYVLIGTEPGISTPGSETITPDLSGNDNSNSSGSGGFLVTAPVGYSKTPSFISSSSAAQTAASNSTDNPIIVLNPGTKSATPDLIIINRTSTLTRTPGNPFTLTPSRTKNVTQTVSLTATPGGNQGTLTPGTYDDTHPLLVYGSGWTSQSETGAYQNTLHVSNTVGSTLTFSFNGQQFRLTFRGGASLGIIRINVGGLNFDLDQSNGTNEWVSTILAQGTYKVTITHLSGGSVNLDSIIVPDFTNTPTVTSTSAPGSP